MSNQFLMLTLTACLASSPAFADNPTDAPPMSNDGNPPATQGEAQKGTRAGKHHRHTYKKDQQRSLNAKNGDPSKNDREQRSPEYVAPANN